MCVNEATSSINCEDDDLFKSIDRSKSKHPKLSDYDQATQTEIKNSIIYYNLNTAHERKYCSCYNTMPIMAARINFLNDKAMKKEFKNICATVFIPKNKGQLNMATTTTQPRRVSTTWRVLFDSGSDGDLLSTVPQSRY